MTIIVLFDPIERILGVIAMAIGIACGMQFLNMGRKKENSQEKIILYGFSFLMLTMVFSNFFFYLLKYEISGYYIDNVFYFDTRTWNNQSFFDLYHRLLIVSEIGGIIGFVLSFERIIKRTRYIFSLLFTIRLICYVIFVICDDTIPSFTSYPISQILNLYLIIWSIISYLIIPIILFFYSRWSKLEFKTISLYLIMGYILIMIYHGIYLNNIRLVILASPINFIMGCIILVIPTLTTIKLKLNSRITIIALIILFVSLIIETYLNFSLFSIYSLSYTILFDLVAVLIAIIYFIDISKSKKSEGAGISNNLQFLSAFSKPEMFTEEEVTISKEKKVCLVCKRKLGGFKVFIYMCPKCNSFYCMNCTKKLSLIENICWACNSPIDPSKPIKYHEKEDEDLDLNIK